MQTSSQFSVSPLADEASALKYPEGHGLQTGVTACSSKPTAVYQPAGQGVYGLQPLSRGFTF